ncbi:acylphosphatase [Clostridium felsineum]|uniref:acylphosphatase n=1 Tax=Clostridium felsineum TaxID=36839 RepID=UPI00098C30F6|nr:acylphosphatase [Clostridium felsineum]URZ15068.1 Acylphosphatase [Clostridium felsineum DSM 794]
MERYLVKVSGRVQGVGFRYFVQSTAGLNQITGTVENCEDGTVRIEIQGEDDNINKFLYEIRKGNTFVHIDEMVTKKIEIIDKERKFKIKY